MLTLIKGELQLTCENCQYRREMPTDPNTLKRNACCIRFPPTPIPLSNGHGLQMVSVFPPVGPDMVCGEHVLITN